MKNTSRRRRRSNKINSCDYLRLENRQLLATLTVTTFNDVIDPHDGLLSLREAVIEANTNDQDDLIELDSGTYVLSRNYVLTHGGLGEDLAATGDLDVTTDDGHSLYVLGAKTGQTTIDAKRIDRVFQVHPHSNVKLQDITITGGATHEPMIMGRRGAGIWSAHSTLELLNVNLDGNQTGEKGVGGGLWIAGGDFSISNSFFMSNGSGGQGSGMFVRDASGEITLSNFRENMIDEKSSGAIYLQDSRLDLTRSTVDENQGVGIYAFQSELDVFHARFFANKGMEVNKTNGGDKGGDEVLETIGGHAIFADKSDVAVDDSKFVRNASYGIGFFDGDRDSDLHDLTVTGSFFQENGNSGIYYKDGRLLSVADSLFIGKENDTDQFFDDSSAGIRASFYRDQLVPENIDVPNSIFVRNVYAGGEAVYETEVIGNLPASSVHALAEVLTTITPFVTGGGSRAALTTILNNLDSNTVPYQVGDAITLSGTKVDGMSFSISVAADGTTTLGDLVTAINSQLTDATANLATDGNLVVSANQTGDALLTVQFEDAAGNAGATRFALNAFVVETDGKIADVVDMTILVLDARGAPHAIQVSFQKTDENHWDARFSSATPEFTLVDDVVASMTFAEDGTLQFISGTGTSDSNIELAIAGLTAGQSFNVSLDRITHRATSFSVIVSSDIINPQIVDTTPLGEETYETEFVGNLPAPAIPPLPEVLTTIMPFTTGASPATLTTLLNNLDNNYVDYRAGDTITVAGAKVDGTWYSVSVSVDGTSTMATIVNAINGQLTNAVATLGTDGNLLITANQTGRALLSVKLTDDVANTGWTKLALNAFIVETDGKTGDVVDTTIQVFDARGAPHVIQVSFQKQGFNRWDARFSSDDPRVTLVDDVVTAITFAEDGSFQVIAGTGSGDSNIELAIAGLTVDQTINVSLDGVTHLPSPYSLAGNSNGGTSRIVDFTIQGDGIYVVDGVQQQLTGEGVFSRDENGFLIEPSTGGFVQRFGDIGEITGFQEVGETNIFVPLGLTVFGKKTTETKFVGNFPTGASQAEVLTTSSPLAVAGAPIDANTLMNDLDSNLVDYATGDSIYIRGTNPDGNSYSVYVPVGPATTVGDIVAAVNARLQGAQLTISATGNLVVTADEAGEAFLRLRFSDERRNTGGTDFYSNKLEITTEGNDSDRFDTSIQVFDLRGAAHTIQVSFQKQGANRWDARFSSADRNVTLVDDVVAAITFAEDGTFQVVSGTGAGVSNIELTIVGLTAVQTIDVSLDDLTHLATNFSFSIEQDGFPSGVIVSFAVKEDGILEARSTNGQRFEIAQLSIR